MSETLGMLIDRLIVVNLKLWHWEEEARREDVGGEYLLQVQRARNLLNVQRNELIEEIDIKLKNFIEGKEKVKVIESLKIYKGGGNEEK